VLAGGPGQAASTLAPFASRLAELRRTRDIVLVDQRGTGRSSPLVCDAFRPRESDVFDPDPVPRAKSCVDPSG
jgi:pimeloyl-ACP methyl ester carboxylesterase